MKSLKIKYYINEKYVFIGSSLIWFSDIASSRDTLHYEYICFIDRIDLKKGYN